MSAKVDVTVRIPRKWLAAAGQVAAWKSTKLRTIPRARVLRRAVELGLERLYQECDQPWPPTSASLNKKPVAPKIDRKLQIEQRLRKLFALDQTLARSDLRREFHHRDLERVDEVLIRWIREKQVVLVQERTPGRSRAVYTWQGVAMDMSLRERLDLGIAMRQGKDRTVFEEKVRALELAHQRANPNDLQAFRREIERLETEMIESGELDAFTVEVPAANGAKEKKRE